MSPSDWADKMAINLEVRQMLRNPWIELLKAERDRGFTCWDNVPHGEKFTVIHDEVMIESE